MTTPATLVDFLRARLDEDERIARAISAPHWDEATDGVGHRDLNELVAVGPYGFMHPDEVAHIARHDPARVLAEVAAKRAVLDLLAAGEKQLAIDWPRVAEYSHIDRLKTGIHAVRMTLARLATAYADHPDYREEWRP